MRFASFQLDANEAWGVVEDDSVLVCDDFGSLAEAIAHGPLSGVRPGSGARRIDLASVRFLPVITRPSKIVCVGLNYENHRRETGRAEVKHPTVFTRFADSQTGHGCPILLPAVTDSLDYEGELAVVIGKPGRSIPRDAAMDHVAGYSCYNDGSVRDWQAHTIQFTPGKNFPETGAFGPWLVTPDEFGAPGPQRVRTRLNGQVMQDAALSDMIFPIPVLIEYISTFTPLAAGDVIVSGTPGGVGVKRDPQVFMRVGDVVEVEIDGIGTLVNSIARAH